tara:strand:- start:1536 stop:2009 length:474 start_codon:yes stop_codon:yes gene_type:complete
MEQIWRTGSGEILSFNAVVAEIREHVANHGSIYVGTDSCVDKNRCVFATAICLHGANEQRGGKYFFRRVSFKRKKFSSLVHRISHEVQQSIELALLLSEDVPPAKIELHIDISPANKGNGTSKFADMLTGYARASGFDYKIKPDAWASQSVADKHSK